MRPCMICRNGFKIFEPFVGRIHAALLGALALHAAWGVPSVRAAEIAITGDPAHRWGESKIVVSPNNPDNIVISAVGTGLTKDCQAHSPACQPVTAKLGVSQVQLPKGQFTAPAFNVVAAFVSRDGGKTWQRVDIPVTPDDHLDLTRANEPNLTATADGTFYFSFDIANWGTPEHPLPNAAVAVSKSIDGGLTWSSPILTQTPMGTPRMSADLSTGTIYEASSGLLGPHSSGVATDTFVPVLGRWLVSSKDGLKWTMPLPMAGEGESMSAAHGVLATAFEASVKPSIHEEANERLCRAAAPPCIVFETTSETASTWSRHVLPGPANATNSPDDQPMVAADPAKPEHFTVAIPMNGKEYRVYQTQDSGVTWTGPVILPQDNAAKHFHPSMAYSEDGILGIVWQSVQPAGKPSVISAPSEASNDGAGLSYSVWATISRDGGASFSAPLRVSSTDSPPPTNAMENIDDDDSSVAVAGDHVLLTWADWRLQERAVFFSDIKLEAFKTVR